MVTWIRSEVEIEADTPLDATRNVLGSDEGDFREIRSFELASYEIENMRKVLSLKENAYDATIEIYTQDSRELIWDNKQRNGIKRNTRQEDVKHHA